MVARLRLWLASVAILQARLVQRCRGAAAACCFGFCFHYFFLNAWYGMVRPSTMAWVWYDEMSCGVSIVTSGPWQLLPVWRGLGHAGCPVGRGGDKHMPVCLPACLPARMPYRPHTRSRFGCCGWFALWFWLADGMNSIQVS